MKKTNRRTFVAGASAAALLTGRSVAFAQKKYADGASDTEIKIGHTNPYSGPASSYGVIGKTHPGLLEERQRGRRHQRPQGELHHLRRRLRPPKTVECVRQLVEQDKVLCTFNTLGTPTNTAIHKYMNQKKVPMLFVATGASKWGDPKNFPWTMGFQPDYHTEARDLRQAPSGQRQGRRRSPCSCRTTTTARTTGTASRRALARTRQRVVKHVDLRDDRPDGRQPGHPAQGLRRQRLLQHRHRRSSPPRRCARRATSAGSRRIYLNNVSSSVASAMKPAGFDNVQGVITALYLMDPTDKQWDDHADMKTWIGLDEEVTMPARAWTTRPTCSPIRSRR